MKHSRILSRATAALALAGAAGTAAAHPGHAASLADGLTHPFLGLDHLLAMVAVGLWSARALPAQQRWQGPAVFVAALLAAALASLGGVSLPGVELSIAASVVLCGALVAGAREIPARAGLALVGATALFHGLAHGAEAPMGGFGGFAAFALGFTASTAALHLAGLWLAARLQRLPALAWSFIGAAVGTGGLALLAARL
ncbi:HupE/UreJ family protein [Azohydromonas lata]|uniref:HupE/UreJ family protein n=1 Tax=Azohydromonas lata TaxID=45677 RepID=A0ABU5IR65_9BURK|nr:HupE/UreJ family protein [Azohydromonas lata]MDZ5461383.1 HupE/UreJ family protein [Azohydromonas lata]